MDVIAVLFAYVVFMNIHIGSSADSYEELDLSGIDLQHATCDIAANEGAPSDCYGLYEMRDVLVNKTKISKNRFLRFVLSADPFNEVIRKAIKTPPQKEFSFLNGNWFNGGDKSLFYRVFDGISTNGRLLRTGYVASFNRHLPYEDQKVESENCRQNSYCVKGICRKKTSQDKNIMITMVENLCPMFEFTLFTVASSKKTGRITDHHITYKVNASFFTTNVFITVTYKKGSEVYSPENVEMVYYSMTRNGYVGVDYICDEFSQINYISIDSLAETDWTCGFYPSLRFYECAGRKVFKDLSDDSDDDSKRSLFIDKVLSLQSFKHAIGHALGGRSKVLLEELWFGDKRYFEQVFLITGLQQNYTNGYVSFSRVVSPSDAQLTSAPGDQSCDKGGHGLTTVEYNNKHMVFLKNANSLYDFTLLTLASVRALMLPKAGQLKYRTQNPWRKNCSVDILVMKSMDGNTINEIRYASSDAQFQ